MLILEANDVEPCLKFWMTEASENILSKTYFMPDGCKTIFIKYERVARAGAFKFLWMAQKLFENFESKIDFHLTLQNII
jgi:hypothetical protein